MQVPLDALKFNADYRTTDTGYQLALAFGIDQQDTLLERLYEHTNPLG